MKRCGLPNPGFLPQGIVVKKHWRKLLLRVVMEPGLLFPAKSFSLGKFRDKKILTRREFYYKFSACFTFQRRWFR
jgi:hypothetical protein